MWSEKFMSIFLPCVCHQKTDLGSLKFSFSVHFSVLILSSVQFSSVQFFLSVQWSLQFSSDTVQFLLLCSVLTSLFSSVHFSVLILSSVQFISQFSFSVQFSSVQLSLSVQWSLQFSSHTIHFLLLCSVHWSSQLSSHSQFSFSIQLLVLSSLHYIEVDM